VRLIPYKRQLGGTKVADMRFIVVAMAASLACGCAGTSGVQGGPRERRFLTEAEAVVRAEEFIRVNGYVRSEDAVPSRMVLERSLTFGTTPEELLPQRNGTLLPRACGVLPEAVLGHEKGWSVVFCYNPSRPWAEAPKQLYRDFISDRARVVVMDTHGEGMLIAHMDFALDAPGMKVLPGRDEFDRIMEIANQNTP